MVNKNKNMGRDKVKNKSKVVERAKAIEQKYNKRKSKGNKISSYKRDLIVELRKRGFSYSIIEKEVKVSKTTIYNILKNNGLVKPNDK